MVGISGSTGGLISFEANGVEAATIYNPGAGVLNVNASNGIFLNSGTGYVAIGTTSASSKLDISAAATGGNDPLVTIENISGATPGTFGPGILLNNHVASTNPFIINQFQGAASFFEIANGVSPYTPYFVISQRVTSVSARQSQMRCCS